MKCLNWFEEMLLNRYFVDVFGMFLGVLEGGCFASGRIEVSCLASRIVHVCPFVRLKVTSKKLTTFFFVSNTIVKQRRTAAEKIEQRTLLHHQYDNPASNRAISEVIG